jgi:peroxiredoxin (alkyl hydroperoxide reductase subunit C)
MKRLLPLLAIMALLAEPARAELKVGDTAPAFSADAVRAGKPVPFALADALKAGPVILYFYPQGPSDTCYVENYEFSFAAADLEKKRISVLAVSSAGLADVAQTSLLECSDKLTLAADPAARLIRSYAAENPLRPGYAQSVGYVIAPDGRIIYTRTNDAKDAVEHVANMIKAAEAIATPPRP